MAEDLLPAAVFLDDDLAHAPDGPIGYTASRSHDMVDSLVDLDSARL